MKKNFLNLFKYLYQLLHQFYEDFTMAKSELIDKMFSFLGLFVEKVEDIKNVEEIEGIEGIEDVEDVEGVEDVEDVEEYVS